MARLGRWVCVLLAILHFPVEGIAAGVQERRAFLVSGMRAQRESLRSGQAVARGQHYIRSKDVKEFVVPCRFEIAFDHSAQLYRFTQSDYAPHGVESVQPDTNLHEPSNSSLPRGETPDGTKWVTREVGGAIVHTAEYDLHRPIDSLTVTRLLPGAVGRTTVKEWDVRTLGLVDWPAFKAGVQYEELLNTFESQLECVSAAVGDSGFSTLVFKAGSTEYEIWIDESSGMTPVSITRTEGKRSARVSSSSKVSWKEINGAWVPISFQINGELTQGSSEGYDLSLEWSNVNQPLDSKLFTPAGITNSASAVVADMRLGQVVIDRVVPRDLPEVAANPVESARPSWLGWIVLAHCAVFCGFAWWYRRSKVSHAAPDRPSGQSG